jgi:preprotein translocase subunit SecA
MEFDNIYGLEVLVIPTNKSLIRTIYPDVVFRTEAEKFDAIIEEIITTNQSGRPILVGTTSIKNSEQISDMLKRRGIRHHEVLNAKYHEREAQIIAQAGRRGAITIATNMAGRGTDIILEEGVANSGGLHVLGTERHEARRIDNQLRGRTGRQGDPGSSRFILSLEDTLLRLFAPDWIRVMLLKLGMSEGTPIESGMISRAIEKAQKRMEAHNFDIRKNLLDYDRVMNEQRNIIYEQRLKILKGEQLKDITWDMIEETICGAIDLYLPESTNEHQWDYDGLTKWIKRKFDIVIQPDDLKGKDVTVVEDTTVNRIKELYKTKETALSAENLIKLERYLLLEKIDEKWKEHLYAMDYLRSGIGLRGYAQVDPKLAYKKEAYDLFDKMLVSIKEEVTDLIFKIRFEEKAETKMTNLWQPKEFVHKELDSFESVSSANQGGAAPVATEKPRPVVVGDKTGRNDPCPCGSGKKYKKCCGQSA